MVIVESGCGHCRKVGVVIVESGCGDCNSALHNILVTSGGNSVVGTN